MSVVTTMQRESQALAAYSLYKCLYSSTNYRSATQIIAEYINYVIQVKGLYRFTAEDIRACLFSEFQFELPTAVIRTALKSVSVTRENGFYTVKDLKEFHKQLFEVNYERLKNETANLVNGLLAYAESKKKDDLNKNIILQDFLHYMLNDGAGSEYFDIISEYVLANSQNEAFIKTLNEIKVGCILYNGIIYNLESAGADVFENGVVFYLDTEILIDLAGYNGELFKRLAEDFMNLVKQANGQENRIQLKCLSLNMDEAISLFKAAENHFRSGRLEVSSTAIEAIMNGCTDESDIAVKQADFTTMLKYHFGIKEEEKESYYKDKEDTKNNLEGIEFPQGMVEKYSSDLLQKSSTLLSHTNKHRGTPIPQSIEKSRVIFITRTAATIEVGSLFASVQANDASVQYVVPLAMPLGGMTNYLWNRLNKGFSSHEFPLTIDVVIKAQTILSKKINDDIIKEYTRSLELYKNKEITKEVLVGRIKILREKPRTPELLTEESFEQAIDFDISELDKFEEERSLAEKRMNDAIMEKTGVLAENQKLKAQLQSTKQDSNDKLTEVQKQNEALHEELREYKEERKKRVERNKKLIAIGLYIILVAIIVGAIAVAQYLLKPYKEEIGYIADIFGLLGVGTFFAGGSKIIKWIVNNKWNNTNDSQ